METESGNIDDAFDSESETESETEDLLDAIDAANENLKEDWIGSIIFQFKPGLICQHCEKKFSQRGHLNRHILTIHQRVKAFPCSNCERWFSQKAALQQHISNVHHRIKPFQCSKCKQWFSRKNGLKAHMERAERAGSCYIRN